MTASHHQPDGTFRNPWPGTAPRGFGSILTWWWRRWRDGSPADPPRGSFELGVPDLSGAAPDQLAATWIGHSAALIEIGSRRILFDPMFGEYAAPVPVPALRRWVAPRPDLDQLPPLDLICLSHNHYDHLDAGSVRRLARAQPGVPWVAPLRLGSFLRRLGVAVVMELDWWDEIAIGDLTIAATPAQHFSARTPWDRGRTLWTGFVVRHGDRRVYFVGDTGYHPEFAAVGRRFGPFDLALIPIGAYEPRWFMETVHLNPEDAVRCYQDLVAGSGGPEPVCLGIHWGTFKLTDEPLDEPPKRMAEAWRRAGLPADRLWILRHGETRRLGGAPR